MPIRLPRWHSRTPTELAQLADDARGGRVIGSWMLGDRAERDHVFEDWIGLATFLYWNAKGSMYFSDPGVAASAARLPFPAHYFAYLPDGYDNTEDRLPSFTEYEILSEEEWQDLARRLGLRPDGKP